MNKFQAFCFSVFIATFSFMATAYLAISLATAYPYRELSLLCVSLISLAVLFTSYAFLVRRKEFKSEGPQGSTKESEEWLTLMSSQGKTMLHPVKSKPVRVSRFSMPFL